MTELFDKSFDVDVWNGSDEGHRLFIPLTDISTFDTHFPLVVNQRQCPVITALKQQISPNLRAKQLIDCTVVLISP